MPEKDFPSESVGEVLTDEEIYLVLQNRLNNWRFDTYSDDENVSFAHVLTLAVIDNFPYLGYAMSQEFRGKELPDAFRPTFANIYEDYDRLSQTYSLGEWYRTISKFG